MQNWTYVPWQQGERHPYTKEIKWYQVLKFKKKKEKRKRKRNMETKQQQTNKVNYRKKENEKITTNNMTWTYHQNFVQEEISNSTCIPSLLLK